MSKNIKILIILLLVIIAGFYFFKKNKTFAPETPAPSNNQASNNNYLNYYCKEGMIQAKYPNTGKEVVLKLDPNNELLLTQSQSASGVIYKNDTMRFVTKGDNAFLTEGDKDIYTNCVLGSDQINDSGSKTFTDNSKTFSFDYPPNWKISGGGIGFSQDWRTNTQSWGLLLVTVSAPDNLEPNTNLRDVTMKVGTSSDPKAIKECLTAQNGEMNKGQKTINGIAYQVLTLSDAGAGNFYDTTSYRTIKNDQCHALEYTIHSLNIGNFPPEQNIKEFNSSALNQQLQSIIESFKFL